ncbi:hypothetical protein FOB45_10750 [Pseudomonas luteola]|nr:hypothetical protein FOB45_10750 [Pseudomonas luteola]
MLVMALESTAASEFDVCRVQGRSRGLTRRRQACCRSRMRVCEVVIPSTLVRNALNGKHV